MCAGLSETSLLAIAKSSKLSHTCADPESFVRGVPTQKMLLFVKGERIQIPLEVGHHRLPAKRHLNGVSLECR